MTETANRLRWNGAPGHYEVYYVSLTDRGSGLGLWIRYTMVAPVEGEGTCSLWFMATGDGAPIGRKADYPVSRLNARADPFRLELADAVLADYHMTGAFEDVAWDLHWSPSGGPYEHVHPLLKRIAATELTLPHADLYVQGTVRIGDREITLVDARGGQAHLWGTKHANRWAWLHCNDFEDAAGQRVPDTFLDGVSVFVPRLGRELGPNTPVVGRFAGEDFISTGPRRVTANDSRFALTGWRLEALDGRRRIVAEIDADREDLVGVTYHDPDGDLAYCYNTEVATLRVGVWERDRGHFGGWRLSQELTAPRRAHFEYAQREPVPGVGLHVR